MWGETTASIDWCETNYEAGTAYFYLLLPPGYQLKKMLFLFSLLRSFCKFLEYNHRGLVPFCGVIVLLIFVESRGVLVSVLIRIKGLPIRIRIQDWIQPF